MCSRFTLWLYRPGGKSDLVQAGFLARLDSGYEHASAVWVDALIQRNWMPSNALQHAAFVVYALCL